MLPFINTIPTIRTFVKVSKLFADASCIVITAFISPYRVDRDLARKLHDLASLPFIEVFVDVPLEVVEARDPKGLYKKARAGEIKGWHTASLEIREGHDISPDFTGISAPYEAPHSPEIHINTHEVEVAEAVRIITEFLTAHGYL